MHEMLHAKGVNWADLPNDLKNGRVIRKYAEGWSAAPAPVWTSEGGRLELQSDIPRHWAIVDPGAS